VDRRTWYRGKGSEESRLLTVDGKRCCIGFVGQQCGVSDDDLRGKSDIRNAAACGVSRQVWPKWMRGDDHDASIYRAYITNDDTDLTDSERETKLKTIFAEYGDEIEFTN
jgi:hypothetical protein